MNTSREACGEIAKLSSTVIARSTLVRRSSTSEGGCDEAIHSCVCRSMDCFACARNDGIGEQDTPLGKSNIPFRKRRFLI